MKKSIFRILAMMLSAVSLQSFALPNPAAVNCTAQGNQYVLLKNTGICIFKDGSYCEEWAYFRKNCKPGQLKFPGGKWDKRNMSNYCVIKTGNRVTVKMCK